MRIEDRIRTSAQRVADEVDPPAVDIDGIRRGAHAGQRRRITIAVAVVATVLMGAVAPRLVDSLSSAPVPPIPAARPTQAASPTPTMGARLTLRGDGIAPFTFGAKQVDVDAVLRDRLGDPGQIVEQGILCPRLYSRWMQVVNYGGLRVVYTAKDQSRKSPRYLTFWIFPVDKQLPAPLAMQDDVPLNLTYNQLKAKYPAGKLYTRGIVDEGPGGRMFILPNKLVFVSNPDVIKPGLVEAGQVSPCG